MSTAARAGPTNHVAVTVLGLLTLLLGGAYAAFGGCLILAGAFLLLFAGALGGWPWVAAVFGNGPPLVIAIGVAFLPLGVLGLLAGVGALLRQPWGRILTFILAVLAILLGLVWVAGGDQNTKDLGLGAAQVLYGILAFVILITKGAAFSRPRA